MMSANLHASSVLVDPDGQIADLARRVITDNIAAGRTIATAESCTGGMVATALVDIPGSSESFIAGLVTYAYSAKSALLGVSQELLDEHGAVSFACVQAMAVGAIRAADVDVAVAISGIAGPDGGTNDKPVGTVMFARAHRGETQDQVETVRHQFDPSGSRADIRRQATLVALELLLP